MTSTNSKMSSKSRGPPIDRGWAWVVMAAAFANMTFCIGFVRSFGILFVEFRRIYQASSSVTALIMGVQGGVFSISGFLAQNVLMTYFSARVTVMVGGFLSSLGVILSVFANSIPLLIVTQSLFLGCGNALIIGPGLVLLGKYFNKHRSLAIAVANTGGNLGAIAMPPLIRFLLDEFGLKGVFLIYGALMLHIIACGGLFRPINLKTDSEALSKKTKGDANENNANRKQAFSRDIPKIIITAPEVKRLLPETETENGDTPRSRTTSASSRTFKDVMESYSESSTVKYTSTPDLPCLSVHDIPSSTDNTGSRNDNWCKTWLHKVLDFSLFSIVRFYLLMTIAVFGVNGGALMGIYIPAIGIDKHATNIEAAAMLSANGAAGACSRIAVGFFADRGIMKRNHILALALTITGITGLLAPLYHGLASLMVFSVINGFFASLYFSLMPVIIVDFLGLPKLAKTFGFLQLVQGASIAASHPIAGLLNDVTGTFNTPYIFFGVSSIVAAILLLLEPCARKYDNRKSNNAKPEESKVALSVGEGKVLRNTTE